MAQNLQIDPTTGDYVIVNGSPVPSDRVEDAAYIALKIRQGEYLYGSPEQGSKLYTLQNRKRTSNIEPEFAGYVKDALKTQLVDTGQATAVGVQNLQTTRTGSSNAIGIVPSTSQLSNQLNFTPV